MTITRKLTIKYNSGDDSYNNISNDKNNGSYTKTN